MSQDIYIPESITVHLGTPSSNARNVTVPFTEYIKNVASSEIYPTWPEEALRANIAAIISLTLNRFFTEWYRSQGYDFDITSTTSYDQSYVQGRNIFENISRIVDDMFNTYVTREGYINPLFTTFCDGRRTTCEGLSQWGSVSLAENGNNALSILRYYYGDDVNLTSTDDIRDAESSYPGTPLKLGDSGQGVLTIQQQLMRIRENYPAIPLIPTIDGNFGSSTDSAVRTFQEIFDLAVDGIVGKSTWYRISYVYSSVAKLAETIGEGVSDIFSAEIPDVTISRGDTGNYVLLLQSLIDYISVFYPSVPAVSKDGIFGSGTADAVRQFASTFGLASGETVTPSVWNALYKVYLNIINSITPSLPNQGFPGRDLRRGDMGENVKLMQTYLNVISSRYQSIPKVTEDGIFGGDTENAVLAFQRAARLNPTGVIDVSTWERIVELYNFEESM
ncbi:MAG: spore cortex-lytic protein [Ruminococcaceae bacterium]|nr:spore cortex-lytic protein [Oscillospiraceae bacterium]